MENDHKKSEMTVRLTPNAGRDRLDPPDENGVHKAWVRAVPEDGKANEALIRLVADHLGVPKSSVTLTTGHKSRIKKLKIKL